MTVLGTSSPLFGSSIKIIQGTAVPDLETYPWLTALVPKAIGSPVCGGSLLDKNHVLTAAHCSNNITVSDYYVMAHRLDFTKTPADEQGLVFSVEKVISHPQYVHGAENTPYDVAIWKVNLELGEFATIKTLPVLDKGVEHAGKEAIVAGWGDVVDQGGTGSPTMREVSLPVIDRETCLQTFPNLHEDSFCAGDPKGGKDSCQGDSGGPLFLKTSPPTVIGVVSYGLACGSTSGVYANVTSLRPWITDTLRSLGADIPIESTKQQKSNALALSPMQSIFFGLVSVLFL